MPHHSSSETISKATKSKRIESSYEKDTIINKAAKILREDILAYASDVEEMQWPPSLTVLQNLYDTIPETVFNFLETLLKDPSHSSSDRVKRLMKSYACDMVNGVTVGKILTLKHYLLGLGFQNFSG